jgi:hypothetical protein
MRSQHENKLKSTAVRPILPALLLTIGLHQTGSDTGPKRPPRVFVDVGACPFECCTYRRWTVEKETALLDRPNGKRVVVSLSKGDVVTGLTGEVISVPIPVKTDRDIPETPIKAGDTFYVLHYDGEGYWKVWFRGKMTSVHQSVIDVPQPKAKWWVKIKDSHGNIGWALSHGNFGNQDACG